MSTNGNKIAQTIREAEAKTKAIIFNIWTDGVIEIANKLQQRSPVGATNQLKEGWDVDEIKNINSIEVKITNNANNSFYRIAGRKPGKSPPVDALKTWVQAKIEPDERKAKRIAFLIGRSIAAKGTRRWRDNANILGVSRSTGKSLSGGFIDNESRKLISKIKNQ